MSSYKASLSRNNKSDIESTTDSKYRLQVQQLQEAFPSWSYEDLQTLLTEVNGDVQVAATRITEGHAEQWGSVTRKKDKKQPASHNPKQDSFSSGRGGGPGGRGGRGGRGGAGAGRGGATGRGRGGARGGANGHAATPSTSTAALPQTPSVGGVSTTNSWTEVANGKAPEPVDGVGEDSWASAGANGWGETEKEVSAAPAKPLNGTAKSTAKVVPPVTKPVTSKLSWAQIARPQEKLTPALASVPPPQAPEPAPSTSSPSGLTEIPPELVTSSSGWEEPTTAQAPVWEDEPSSVSKPSLPEIKEQPLEQPEAETANIAAVSEPVMAVSAAVPELTPETPAQASPVVQSAQITKTAPSRPTSVSHRSSARYKNVDQPVVMPNSVFGSASLGNAGVGSFGSLGGTGMEKVGMQFGSLGLGSDSFDDGSTTGEPLELQAQPPAQAQASISPKTQSHEPSSSALSNGSALFQQSLPQQVQPTPPQQQQSITQGSTQNQPTQVQQVTPSPLQPFSQGLSNHQQPQSATTQQQQYVQHGLPTHVDQQSTQSPQQPPTHHFSQAQPQVQSQQGQQHSTYFRQPDAAPYFHSATPPAVGQGQDSPYGAFGLGHQQQHQHHPGQHQGQVQIQGQHQGQPNHLGGFGGEYGYGDNQRGFYDSYAQQSSGFGNRSMLSHDELKGLPNAQQPTSNASLPPSSSQGSQHPGSAQGNAQPQPSAGGGPQQYPPPLPYYYPYPQNQYYGSPYNAPYGVTQPFVKYPTMFQPGPPGPGSAPSPATKQPSSIPPQSNPYNQGLYGQQHPSGGYDDSGYQHHNQQHHAQNSPAGLPSNDYGKQLYGGGQGMQGFMGLGQSTGPAAVPPLGQRAGGSPETSYKPYAPNSAVKDVGGGVSSVGIGQGGVSQSPQTRTVGQQGQGFYGGNRFSSASGAGPQGQQSQQLQPQNQGSQGGGYPQGASDSNFYSYHPRQQQQQYWQ